MSERLGIGSANIYELSEGSLSASHVAVRMPNVESELSYLPSDVKICEDCQLKLDRMRELGMGLEAVESSQLEDSVGKMAEGVSNSKFLGWPGKDSISGRSFSSVREGEQRELVVGGSQEKTVILVEDSVADNASTVKLGAERKICEDCQLKLDRMRELGMGLEAVESPQLEDSVGKMAEGVSNSKFLGWPGKDSLVREGEQRELVVGGSQEKTVILVEDSVADNASAVKLGAERKIQEEPKNEENDESISKSIVLSMRSGINSEDEAAIRAIGKYYADADEYQDYVDAYKNPKEALRRKERKMAWIENEINQTARDTEKRKLKTGNPEKKHFEYAEVFVPVRTLTNQLESQKAIFKAEAANIGRKCAKYGWAYKIKSALFSTYSMEETIQFLYLLIARMNMAAVPTKQIEKRRQYYLGEAKRLIKEYEKTHGKTEENEDFNYYQSSTPVSEEEFTDN